jgi:putative membrane protein
MWDNTHLVLTRAGEGPWSWDHAGWQWMMGLHGAFWLVLVTLLLIALVMAARAGARRRRDSGALAVLEARYARGEIDRDEFLHKKRDFG